MHQPPGLVWLTSQLCKAGAPCAGLYDCPAVMFTRVLMLHTVQCSWITHLWVTLPVRCKCCLSHHSISNVSLSCSPQQLHLDTPFVFACSLLWAMDLITMRHTEACHTLVFSGLSYTAKWQNGQRQVMAHTVWTLQRGAILEPSARRWNKPIDNSLLARPIKL